MVEFAFVFLLFLSTILAFLSLSFAVWVRATLSYAVRQGVRYAITGQTAAGAGQTDSIRTVVLDNSVGLLDPTTVASDVAVVFRNSQGIVVNDNSGGNLVEVTVAQYPLPLLADALLFILPDPVLITVSAAGRLEPYPIPPPL